MVAETLGKQLIRSGTSILASYTESKSAVSKKDFVNFLSYSLKSANESKFWISLLMDTNKGDKNELKYLLSELKEIAGILAKSILTIKTN